MTVIAGKVYERSIIIGADSQTTYGQNKEESTKLFQVRDDIVMGAAGYASESQLMYLYSHTHQPRSGGEFDLLEFFIEFHEWAKKKDSDFEGHNSWLMTVEGRLVSIVDKTLIRYHDNHYAVGSGRDFAKTALHLGKSVEQAIKIACDLTIYCSAPINVIKVRT